MRYGLRRMILGVDEFLELTDVEYSELLTARERLWQALHIEQKFRLLLTNYEEFENELLCLANHQMVFHELDWDSMHDDIYEISRRLINLLTTSRLYVDQVKHDISDMCGKESAEFVGLEKNFSEQYDSLLGYRVMESLRNFVQHRGLPVHSLSYNSGLTNSKSGKSIDHICTPCVSVKELKAEGGFKPNVLIELEAIADSTGVVDLKPLIRAYVGGLAAVHRKLHETLRDQMKRAETVFSKVCDSYQKAFPNSALVGVAIVEEEAKRVVSQRYLVPEGVERWKRLIAGGLNFEHHFVSSQCIADRREYKQNDDLTG